MTTSDQKPSISSRTLRIGSCLAAGAMMLSHLNRSALTRYDDLLHDLARFHPHQGAPARRADRPLRKRPVSDLRTYR